MIAAGRGSDDLRPASDLGAESTLAVLSTLQHARRFSTVQQ
jgi:hypothetical protein